MCRDQIVLIRWTMEKAREFQKNIYFCFTDHTQAFDCADHSKLWKIIKELEIPDHLICLLRNLYADQEATVIIRHGTMDWLKIGKGVHQDCILSLCLFNDMQSTSCEKLGWMNHKQESRLPGEISITSNIQISLFFLTAAKKLKDACT